MLRQFIQNKNGQNTAEYALLIALVVAGIIAMQTYAQRALQARVRDASVFMATSTNGIGNTLSYESGIVQENHETEKEAIENKRLGAGTVAADSTVNKKRVGGTTTTYQTNATKGSGDVVKGL